MLNIKNLTVCLMTTLSSGAIFPAMASDVGSPKPPAIHRASDWNIQITPYSWAAAMKGDVSPFRHTPTVQVEKSFSDILNDLNVGGFINIWARKDKFVFSADAMYVNLTESGVSGPLPIIGVIRARYDTSQFAATLQGGYRIYEGSQFTFDVLAGARVWGLTNDLQVHAAGRTVTIANNFGWVDPVVGGRALYRINERFSVLAQGDFGGLGGGSKLTWQALGTVNYTLNQNISISAGYKWLSVNYERDGRVFDASLFGPVLGMTYRF